MKRAITRSRPLGSKLNSCKSPVQRDLVQIVRSNSKKPNVLSKTADADLDKKKRAELAEFETHVKCTSTSSSENALTVLSTAVARIEHDPKSVSTSPESVTEYAEQKMKTLLAKLSFLGTQSALPADSGTETRMLEEICAGGVLQENQTPPFQGDETRLTDWTPLNFLLRVWLRQM